MSLASRAAGGARRAPAHRVPTSRSARAGAGDWAAALRAYERCRRLLAEELAVPPSPETEALHRTLREGR